MHSRKLFLVTWSMAAFMMPLLSLAKATDVNVTAEDSVKGEPFQKLSRCRRYLVFPEGSSFQFVFDSVVAVVHNVNYISLSVTLALAWALPDRPPSELFMFLKDHLKQGFEQLPYNESMFIPHSPDLYTDVGIDRTNTQNGFGGDGTESKFLPQIHRVAIAKPYPWKTLTTANTNPFQQYVQPKGQNRYGAEASQYPWWRIQDSATNYQPWNRAKSNRRHYQYSPLPRKIIRHRVHHVYPILGKRNGRSSEGTHRRYRRREFLEKSLPSMDQLHIRHQRRTRLDLYEVIEKHLDRKKLNGHHCILRTLCETEQKSMERKPGSFVAELMRAMFSLPDEIPPRALTTKEQSYDAAQASEGDCASHYPQCKHSVWSSSFVT